MPHLIATGALLFVLLLTACSSRSQPSVSNPVTLYSSGIGTVLRIDNASLANGAVTPSIISGPSTLLGAINSIVVDAAANRLFVGNIGYTAPGVGGATPEILIFDSASTKVGNVVPDRVVFGDATTLFTPFAMVLDTGRDLLYVANGTNILIFSNASTMNGNVAPASTLGAPFITFFAGGLALDQANDRLFVSNPSGNEIICFDHASQLGSAPTGSRLISGPSTGLAEPQALALDRSGRLLVGNILGGITIYANAGAIAGDTAPVATIQGPNTQFLSAIAMGLDGNPGSADSGDLYVLDSNSSVANGQNIVVFTNIGAAGGNLVPARVLTIPFSASAFDLTRLAIDTTR